MSIPRHIIRSCNGATVHTPYKPEHDAKTYLNVEASTNVFYRCENCDLVFQVEGSRCIWDEDGRPKGFTSYGCPNKCTTTRPFSKSEQDPLYVALKLAKEPA